MPHSFKVPGSQVHYFTLLLFSAHATPKQVVEKHLEEAISAKERREMRMGRRATRSAIQQSPQVSLPAF